MEPSKEAIAVRISRLNRQILGKITGGTSKLTKTIDRETLLDALTVLYDECNDDPVKKVDELVKAFVDKYRSTLADLRRTRVCLSDFHMLQVIGRGHFGEVHMVREKQTGDVYALKCMRKETAVRRAGGAAEDERDVLAAATAPWMPRLQYAFQDNSNLYLVMELCIGGDLAGLMSRRNHPLSERDAAFYVAEVAHALKALHGMGFVHRDVKPHNILLDRCGHVKLGDFGSCARLSTGAAGDVCRGGPAPVGTWDYVAPELLAAAACAQRHAVCLQYCRGIVHNAISACDYWSLGVVAFELVTLRRPFSTDEDDSIAQILDNIQKYEREADPSPPFLPPPNGPSSAWRSLVAGLLTVPPAKRYNYLDTLQHAALSHLPSHTIRDQAPPWVPIVRGPEDASCFSPPPREPQPPSAAPFRARPPFAGQLPYVGYSYVAIEDNEDSSGGFNASHDCTAIDLATFKSAEKLAAMRGREISALQSKLAAAEAAAGAEAERGRREADAEAERQRARLQAEITALSLQNRRLERQIEVEKEERMALERTNQQLSSTVADRTNAELRAAQANATELTLERDALREQVRRLEARVADLTAECTRAQTMADAAQQQQKHYKDVIEQAQHLRHRRLTEINVKALDTIAKERALRRQTLSGGEAETREAGARAAQAEASAAREMRAREHAEKKLAAREDEIAALRRELDDARRELARSQESLGERKRCAEASTDQLREAHTQLAQERARVTALTAQVQELERSIEASGRREVALEEQCARTEARLHARLDAAETRAAAALSDHARHRDKVNTLEQLVRQLEREVSALEKRTCAECAARAKAADAGVKDDDDRKDAHSDTESLRDVGTDLHLATQATVLKEQLERAEAQLQARADEIATLRQEARTANLARWRKEREYNELSVEMKSTTRELKRVEERLTAVLEAKKSADQKASSLQSEIATLRPQYQQASKDAERYKEQLEKLKKAHETAQAEVDRSRNDIRKLKSELQYSEKRRLHAEEQEELSSRERAQLRDELSKASERAEHFEQNNKALHEACSILEEQLTDLEKLADMHELKSKDLEKETGRMRGELESCRRRLEEAERAAAERAAAASAALSQHDEARDQVHHAHCQLQLLRERLENREARVAELELRATALETQQSAAEAALAAAVRRVRDLQEECSQHRTRAHQHHAAALQLQAELATHQEEIAALREASEAATAWWRTRETKADATLRQQAKLIDFLQAKVEEASRKKCSLSNKLFGRSGRRPFVSPPLRRANRELREEVDRLRAKLSTKTVPPTPPRPFPSTPKLDQTPKTTPQFSNLNRREKRLDMPDMPDNDNENELQVVWPNGSRERMQARCSDGVLVLSQGDKEYRAHFLTTEVNNLPQNEVNRAFTVSIEGNPAVVVCGSASSRAGWVSAAAPPAPPAPAPAPAPYRPAPLAALDAKPRKALILSNNAVAIGCEDGLHSLRGPVSLETGSDPPQCASVTELAAAGGRVLCVRAGGLLQCGLLALGSALRRAPELRPTLTLDKVRLPDLAPPHLLRAVVGEVGENHSCVVVACGRRLFLLRWDAAAADFKICRSLTVDRPPASLLLTPTALYIAGEKPLRLNLPQGALETFAIDDPTIAAAAKKHSLPRTLLKIRHNPIEILICYNECGVFVDENGKRTRNEDPKWSSAVQGWEFVTPFLYLVGEEKITILYITDDAYKAPPCTCDTASVASTVSECYLPVKFNLKLKEPALIGVAPNGIVVRTKTDEGYSISIVNGMAAMKSVGASVESLDSVSDAKDSNTDLNQSLSDVTRSPSYDSPPSPPSPQDISQESVETNTGFLADIRKRAKQLRSKHRKDRSPEDVIKEILTTEVGLTRSSTGRKSPAIISECDSDSSDEQNGTESSNNKGTDDICAEMFTRQVRFQPFD